MGEVALESIRKVVFAAATVVVPAVWLPVLADFWWLAAGNLPRLGGFVTASSVWRRGFRLCADITGLRLRVTIWCGVRTLRASVGCGMILGGSTRRRAIPRADLLSQSLDQQVTARLATT